MVIAVLDSGYSGKEKERIIGGISISEKQGNIVIQNDFSDTCGHGTAVTDLLIDYCGRDIQFFIVQMLDQDAKCNSEVLIKTFQYIYQNVECNLIHISAGVERLDDMQGLQNTISDLTKKGIHVVAAYANNGSVSYPAAFENVFGVDMSTNKIKKMEYEFVEGSIVDFRTSSNCYRVNWDGKAMILNGSSFSSTVITAEIAKIMNGNPYSSFEKIKEQLKNKAKYVYKKQELPQLISAKKIAEQIRKAIVLPFNKEMFQFAGNEDLCSFQIKGYYTHKYDMNIGKKISQVLKYTSNEKRIESMEAIPWDDDFDTIILGHCDEINAILKSDITSEVLLMAAAKNKKVYSLANLTGFLHENPQYSKQFVFPYVDISHVPQNRFGKLRKTNRPMVAVMGTSSKQGKFHVQLALRKRFMSDGYRVFQIATEPTGYLFQMDYVYPMGYESTLYIQEQDAIVTLNEELRNADEKNADIIICGSQSGTVPFRYDNVSQLTVQQAEFLMALNPDVAVLCINYDDDFKYIERTKNFIESLNQCRVIGFAMLPTRYENAINSIKKIPLCENELEEKREEIRNHFHLNLFCIGDESDMDGLYDEIIEFF
ncbi:MAG: DUF1611 domain-containing protein [Lachnospiraceae bacterium]|nr:DUF1611 domain-containing protein [Lachnospiraceae bacterium]